MKLRNRKVKEAPVAQNRKRKREEAEKNESSSSSSSLSSESDSSEETYSLSVITRFSVTTNSRILNNTQLKAFKKSYTKAGKIRVS